MFRKVLLKQIRQKITVVFEISTQQDSMGQYLIDNSYLCSKEGMILMGEFLFKLNGLLIVPYKLAVQYGHLKEYAHILLDGPSGLSTSLPSAELHLLYSKFPFTVGRPLFLMGDVRLWEEQLTQVRSIIFYVNRMATPTRSTIRIVDSVLHTYLRASNILSNIKGVKWLKFNVHKVSSWRLHKLKTKTLRSRYAANLLTTTK